MRITKHVLQTRYGLSRRQSVFVLDLLRPRKNGLGVVSGLSLADALRRLGQPPQGGLLLRAS